jgi:hypothetical protein
MGCTLLDFPGRTPPRLCSKKRPAYYATSASAIPRPCVVRGGGGRGGDLPRMRHGGILYEYAVLYTIYYQRGNLVSEETHTLFLLSSQFGPPRKDRLYMLHREKKNKERVKTGYLTGGGGGGGSQKSLVAIFCPHFHST